MTAELLKDSGMAVSPESGCPIAPIRQRFMRYVSTILGRKRKNLIPKTKKEVRVAVERSFYTEWIAFHRSHENVWNGHIPYETLATKFPNSPDIEILEDVLRLFTEDARKLMREIFVLSVSAYVSSMEKFVAQNGNLRERYGNEIVDRALFPLINGTAFLCHTSLKILYAEWVAGMSEFLSSGGFRRMLITFGAHDNAINQFVNYRMFATPTERRAFEMLEDSDLTVRMLETLGLIFRYVDEYPSVCDDPEKFDILVGAAYAKRFPQGSEDADQERQNAETINFQIGEFFKGKEMTGCPFYGVRTDRGNEFRNVVDEFLGRMAEFLRNHPEAFAKNVASE